MADTHKKLKSTIPLNIELSRQTTIHGAKTISASGYRKQILYRCVGMKETVESNVTMSGLTTHKIALITVFSALYVVLAALPTFPVIGGGGKGIAAAVIIAPLIGLILGSYTGTLAVIIGGVIVAFAYPTAPFGPFSFFPHLAAAFCAGILRANKQVACIVIYMTLLLVLAFFPVVGPIWLWPLVLWMDLVGLFVVASPLQYKAIAYLNEASSPVKLSLGVAVTCFTSTLFGHVAGNILFAAMNWPNVDFLMGIWQETTVIYPIERLVITAVATVVGTALLKSLKTFRLEA